MSSTVAAQRHFGRQNNGGMKAKGMVTQNTALFPVVRAETSVAPQRNSNCAPNERILDSLTTKGEHGGATLTLRRSPPHSWWSCLSLPLFGRLDGRADRIGITSLLARSID